MAENCSDQVLTNFLTKRVHWAIFIRTWIVDDVPRQLLRNGMTWVGDVRYRSIITPPTPDREGGA